ncbi:MAG: methionine biosynthesis protein MetW [Opitutales bacterium]
MARKHQKRYVDFQVISQWVIEGSRVLDIGCGRGVLLDYLRQTRKARVLGVDIDPEKITACVQKGIAVYQGDGLNLLATFADNSFDRIILSRTVEELDQPARVLEAALRVGRTLTVGFVNHGYWLNRLSYLMTGSRPVNDVYPETWYTSRPQNRFSHREFLDWCATIGCTVRRRHCLAGDWSTPVSRLVNLRAGYVIVDLEKEG